MSELTLENYKFPSEKLVKDVEAGKTPLVLVACGSFNPPHIMHLRMFEEARNALAGSEFQIVGGFLSPVNPNYKKPTLAPFPHRLAMTQAAVESSSWLVTDAWEGLQPEYQRTLWVLKHMRKEIDAIYGAGKCAIRLLCGADLLQSFASPGVWVPSMIQEIFCDFGVVVLQRPGSKPIDDMLKGDDFKTVLETEENLKNALAHTLATSATEAAISSTAIRENFQTGRSNKYLLTDAVIDYVEGTWSTSNPVYQQKKD
eukprot:TRINITY_DN68123_c2_g8_i1.p1 TRINITY_DN68123_c2_g8~~TRINITY_DN68123_c2_g8_i1.p1  ORF type:complete len:257 (+),score=46.08 TRINITY_DN68123_c2_g8_i1:52-822(+)